jgi:hypothetical protein
MGKTRLTDQRVPPSVVPRAIRSAREHRIKLIDEDDTRRKPTGDAENGLDDLLRLSKVLVLQTDQME